MKNPTKEQKRTTAVIILLSNEKKISTQNLLYQFNNLRHLKIKNRHLIDIEKGSINDQNLSRVLAKLESKKIILRETYKTEKKGARPLYCSLINEHETLYKILNLNRSSNFDEWDRARIRNELFESSFFQKLINKELVNKLNEISKQEEWLDTEAGTFSDDDLDHILKIIKISPSALGFVLALIYDRKNRKFFVYPPLSKFTLNGVIFNFLNDLRSNHPTLETLNKYPINYKIEISLTNNTAKSGEWVKKDIKTNFSNNKISHEVNSSIEPLRDEYGRNKKVIWESQERG